jgi:transcriptional repressor NF-X1
MTRPHTQEPKADNIGGALAPEHPPTQHPSDQDRQPQSSRRRRAPGFNANLTDQSIGLSRDAKEPESSRKRDVPSHQDDLTSRLIRDFQTRPHPDCVICFNSIHPAQPTWSCSPSSPVADVDSNVRTSNLDNKDAHCCWTTFHIKCIRAWAAKSLKPVSEVLSARNEDGRSEWPCPACRAKRLSYPSDYR